MRIDDIIKDEQRIARIGNHKQPNVPAGPPKLSKNRNYELFQDFCSYDSDSYTEYSEPK